MGLMLYGAVPSDRLDTIMDSFNGVRPAFPPTLNTDDDVSEQLVKPASSKRTRSKSWPRVTSASRN